MNALQWLVTIALGAFMGLIGQSIRVVIGLKKAKDAAAINGQKFTEEFEPSTLLVSLLIGAAAGAIAAVSTIKPNAAVSADSLFALAGAGYAGADFLEGFTDKYFPGKSAGMTPVLTQPAARTPGTVPTPNPVQTPPSAIAQAPAPVSPLPAPN